MVDWAYMRQLSQMQTFEDVQAFEQKINELCNHKDSETLLRLMDLFDDDCPYPEVMYTLVHAVEYYPDEIYVQSVLKNMNLGLKNYPNWYLTLVYGILNHPNCLKLFKSNMHLAEKDSLLKLLEIMEKESPHHKDLIGGLRKQLEEERPSV